MTSVISSGWMAVADDDVCTGCGKCVQACPTGVLEFGQIDAATGAVLKKDRLAASPVLMAERGS